jgi:hypothetical protein
MQSHAGLLGSVREPWAHNWASRNSSQNILRGILAAIIVGIAGIAQAFEAAIACRRVCLSCRNNCWNLCQGSTSMRSTTFVDVCRFATPESFDLRGSIPSYAT